MAAASAHTPGGSLRVRDEQANPILIPDYVPREPLPKAGCSVAIGAVWGRGAGDGPPPSRSFRVRTVHPRSKRVGGVPASQQGWGPGEQPGWPRFLGWEELSSWRR